MLNPSRLPSISLKLDMHRPQVMLLTKHSLLQMSFADKFEASHLPMGA
jgi:hypothetical protein